jgi:ribosome-binding factor A
MAKHRAERFSGELQRELGAIISREVKDPRLEFVSVVAVDAAPDLTSARVHLSALNNKYSAEEIKAALNSCSGFIRRELASSLNLRMTPELTFIEDTSVAYGAHIASILNKLEISPEEDDEQSEDGEEA